MYTDIGHRNHAGVKRNGFKLVEKWKEDERLKALAERYKRALDEMDDLYRAANLIVNF